MLFALNLHRKALIHRILVFSFASVWLINGLYCKLLNQVPRHEIIIGRILETQHSRLFSIIIGTGEVIIALWIISGFKKNLITWTQIILIATMNLIEFILIPDLLLFGKLNLIFAMLLCLLIWTQYRLERTSLKIQNS